MDDKKYIYDQLNIYDIEINPQYKTVFDSHITVLIDRLEHNECAKYDDMTFLNEIPQKCIDIAKQILLPLFSKYSVDVSDTEIGLFAIYINLSNKEE